MALVTLTESCKDFAKHEGFTALARDAKSCPLLVRVGPSSMVSARGLPIASELPSSLGTRK